ncbi:MAG: anti-sigma factor [Planctomycetota bacterium]|jgi:anti-sigma factor RsiW
MNSRQLIDTLHDYVAGELPADEVRALEARIASDDKVRELHDEIRAAHEALVSLRERPAPPVSGADALPNIRAAIARESFEARPKLYMDGSGRRFYQRVAMAATLMLAVTLGFFAATRGGDQSADVVAQPAPVRPNAHVRGIVPVVAGEQGIDAATLFDLLKKSGQNPEDLRTTPNRGMIPVSDGLPERR